MSFGIANRPTFWPNFLLSRRFLTTTEEIQYNYGSAKVDLHDKTHCQKAKGDIMPTRKPRGPYNSSPRYAITPKGPLDRIFITYQGASEKQKEFDEYLDKNKAIRYPQYPWVAIRGHSIISGETYAKP